jgi:hypothetical protein
MKRLALLAVLPLLGGCMFPQGWHWPRLGSNTTETVVYVQNDVAGYQGPYLAFAASYYSLHPELAIRMVDTCPTGVNCVVARTENLAYPNVGLTWVSTGSTPHLLKSVLRLDPDVGRVGTISYSKMLVFHEFCHALGGGFRDDIHHLCNWAYRSAIFSGIARVYHNDPG